MAGLGRKEWSPGDTLTAADVNGYLMDQSVMVFAGTAERGSAIPTPSAGMVAYSTATNLEYYDGTAWEQIGVAPGLVRVGGGVLSGASTTFNSVFSATYHAYKVVLTDLLSSDHTYFQIGAATSAYYSCGATVNYSTGVYRGEVGSNAAQFNRLGYSAGTNYFGATIEIQNPFLSVETAAQWSFIGTNTGDGSAMMSGFLDTTASYTSLKIGASSGNLTGTCNIYGYVLS